MTDKVDVDWGVDQDDVTLTIKIRMPAVSFLDLARRVYHAVNPLGRVPADHVISGNEHLESRKTD